MKRALALGILLVGGCRGMGGMIEEKESDEGTKEVYQITKDKALEVAKMVLKEQGGDSFEESKDYVIASFYVNLITPGSYCGVYPKEVAGGCEVRVIARRKSAVSAFTGLTEGGFHDAFKAKLKEVAQK